MAAVGNREGGRHPGEATADDQRCRLAGERPFTDRLCGPHARHRQPHQFQRLAVGQRRLFRVDARALLLNINQLQQVRVQTGLAGHPLEKRFVRAVAAGGDHDPV